MAIDFATLQLVLPIVTKAKHPVLIRGRHGIGKSQTVYQFAESIGMPMVERRASQMTEGDLLGLPELTEGSADQRVTSFCPPDWFEQACSEGVVLFLDEVDRATLEVRQGIFELCDSRKLAGFSLHPDTLIFAAVNGGVHAGAASYQVGEMDPAELDRYTVFDVEPTVEDWINWATDKVDPIIVNFIRDNRDHLEHNDDPEPNKVYPSRRSWDRLSSGTTGMLEPGTTNPVVYALACAYVGFEAAVALNDYIASYSKIVTPEDVIDHAVLPELDLNGHCALIDKMGAGETFKTELSDSQIANLAVYFLSLNSEAAMKLWTTLGETCLENSLKLHPAVKDHLVTILGG